MKWNQKKERRIFKWKRNGFVIEYDTIGEIITKGEFLWKREGEWLYLINDYKEMGELYENWKWKAIYINTGKIKFRE